LVNISYHGRQLKARLERPEREWGTPPLRKRGLTSIVTTEEDPAPQVKLMQEALAMVGKQRAMQLAWQTVDDEVGLKLSGEVAAYLASLVKDY